MLVTFNDVSFKYLDKNLLNKVNFTINDTDKIGVVGINGAGKTTLLKAICGLIDIQEGTIFKKQNLTISYLPQDHSFDKTNTIMEVCLNNSDVVDFEIKSMLSKLGIDDFNKQIGLLSGGELRRVSLALTLVKKADLLILDEPTNHLDIWMINWLEKFLIKWNKALLLVTHDRYFLERITSKTLELEQGNLYLYEANYSKYLILKSDRLNYELSHIRKLSAILKKEAVWASLNPSARSTKSKERLERFNELEKEYSSKLNIINDSSSMSFNSISSRLGKKTIEINDLSKTIEGKSLFSNFNYNVLRLDRLGIVGRNGTGKTSLFKAILGQISKDKGEVVFGDTVKIGYLEQDYKIASSNKKIIDYLKEFGEIIKTKEGDLTASQLLENFCFSKTTQYMPINSLSGGEKRRLQLLTILITNPNVLLLDEPTNDLDIYTLELLENFLEQFLGAVIVISHDRYFLDKVTNHCFILEDGKMIEYTGLISDYITESISKKAQNEKAEKPVIYIPRFTSKEKKEFDNIGNKIKEIENKIELKKQEQNIYSSDYQKLITLLDEINQLEDELLNLLEREEYLNDLNNQIEEYRKGKHNG